MEPATVYVVMYENEIEGVFLIRSSAEEAMKFWISSFGDADNFYIEESKLYG